MTSCLPLNLVRLVCTLSTWVAALAFINIYATAAVIFFSIYISFRRNTMRDGHRVMAFSATYRLLGKVFLFAGMTLARVVLPEYFAVIEFMRPL